MGLNKDPILAMVNPWALRFTDEVFDKLDALWVPLGRAHVQSIPREVIEQHYIHIKMDPKLNRFFLPLIQAYECHAANLAIYLGEWSKAKEVKEKIRAEYQSQMPRDLGFSTYVLHTSTSKEEWERESCAWKDFIGHIKV